MAGVTRLELATSGVTGLYKEICNEIVELQKNGLGVDQAIEKASRKRAKAPSTVKEIYYDIKLMIILNINKNLKTSKE